MDIVREIKFRAKHKVLGWKYGTVLYTANDDMWQLVDENSVFYEINRKTLGQFTGLYDKNKVPIYEGDIILTQPFRDKPYSKNAKSKRLKVIVKYNVKCGNGFCGEPEKMKYWGAEWTVEIIEQEEYKKYDCYDWGPFYECEVIGNIYDNKDLLGE